MTMELIYRQCTSYHMFFLAGFVGILMTCINEVLDYETDFLIQVFICGTCAVLGELLFGLMFNMDYSIWDYRGMKFTLFYSQIQLYFALLWYLMAFIFIPVLDYIDYHMFPREGIKKPYYKIFRRYFYYEKI